MTLPTLKNAYTSSQITELETLIDNKVASLLSSGVYLVKVNGDLVRYDTISDTPIQDAINAAQPNVSSYDSVLLVNYETSPSYKMEQNIILRNGVNLYAIGNTKIYSNSSDNVPLFTDNGQFVQVFFVGYWNMVRYGGAGTNNRCAVITSNIASQIYFTDFVVADTFFGSTNTFDCTSLSIDMGIWVGAAKVSFGTSSIKAHPSVSPNLIVTGGTVEYTGNSTICNISSGTLTYKGNVSQLIQSGGTIYFEGNINTSVGQTGGISYISNSKIGYATLSTGELNISSSIIGDLNVGQVNKVDVSSGTARIDNCKIFGVDDGANPAIGVYCSGGIAIVSYSTIVVYDQTGGGAFSLSNNGGTINNYYSVSNEITDGSISIMALTVNSNVQ
jgi:hypothetical protein